MEDRNTYIIHWQCYGCWWPGDIGSQGTRRHGIVGLFFPEYNSLITRRVRYLFFIYFVYSSIHLLSICFWRRSFFTLTFKLYVSAFLRAGSYAPIHEYKNLDTPSRHHWLSLSDNMTREVIWHHNFKSFSDAIWFTECPNLMVMWCNTGILINIYSLCIVFYRPAID